MKYLFDNWSALKAAIRNCRHLLLLLDYDGTLTPIVSTPEEAILGEDMKRLLNHLSKKDKFTVGIISGRKLSEIKKMVGLGCIFYAGNHGLEIEGPGIKFIHPIHIYSRRYLKRIKECLRKEIRLIKGARLEDKGLCLAVHYRLVEEIKVPRIKEIFKRVTYRYLKRKIITIGSGKKVLEVRPPTKWNKGKAVKVIEKLIFKKRGGLTIYIGDDTTDEDAFSTLRNNDFGIYVGRPRTDSQARYFLRNTQEVKGFLERLRCLN